MKQISISELNKLATSTTLLTGSPVSYGGNVYMIFTLPNGVKWINRMPYDQYIQDTEKYNTSPSGWYALLRIA